MPDTTKRVIIEHHASTPGVDAAKHRLMSERHQENWATWLKVSQGGTIICKSYGAAINERQSLYITRKLYREAYGTTPFDHLTIRLDTDNRDNKLIVEGKPSNILEIIPDPANAPTPATPAEQALTDRLRAEYEAELAAETPPTTPYEGDGRPPIDINEIFPDKSTPPKPTH